MSQRRPGGIKLLAQSFSDFFVTTMTGRLSSLDFGFRHLAIAVKAVANPDHRHFKSLCLSPNITLGDFNIQRCPFSKQVSQF